MGDELAVWSETLRSAARGWRVLHGELRDVRRQLGDVEDAARHAGPRVAPALRAYTDTWMQQMREQAVAAERHADALDEAAVGYDHTDRGSADALGNLLAWEDRDAAPGTVGPGSGVR